MTVGLRLSYRIIIEVYAETYTESGSKWPMVCTVCTYRSDSLGCDKLAAIVFHGVKASHQAQYMATTIGLDD